MERFAFVVHPIDVRRDVARRYPIARILPVPLIEWLLTKHNPVVVCEVKGVRSTTGKELEGWFIGCPLTPHQMVSLPYSQVLAKLEQCGHIAEQLGAGIMGLGAFTSVVGDGGISLAKRLPNIAITTGNSYTVATAIQGAKEAARLMGKRIEEACVAVVGATGSIGATCAELFAREAPIVALVGRDLSRLERLAERLKPHSRAELQLYTDVATGLRNADVVITVTSAVDAIILPEHIKRGAVICDVARPRDVSVRVAKERHDVLVIEGGVVQVPGEMHLPVPGRPEEEFHFGFPPNTAYACMSETMALALEGRYESFTLGKDVSVQQVDEINAIAQKHGFRLAGFRAFEEAVTPEQIERIRQAAGVVSHAVQASPNASAAPSHRL